jgi:hypothetical protein
MRGAPSTKQAPRSKKQPSGGESDPVAILHQPLSWHLSEVDFAGKWGWHRLAADQLSNLHKQLLDYERETLAALKRQHRARLIPTADLCSEAQKRLLTTRRDDAELWELRLGYGRWRAWGIVRGSIFYFLWWDPEHTVCPELPKGKRRAGR